MSAADLEPTQGAESAYTIEKVESAGENTILTYEIDKQTNALIPQYYRIELKTDFGGVGDENAVPLYYKLGTTAEYGQPQLVAGSEADHLLTYWYSDEYGEKGVSGAVPVYFKWELDETGSRTLVAGDVNEHDIIYWKDPSLNYDSLVTGTNGADINHGFAGLSNEDVGGAIFNPQDEEIGNIFGDFVGNSSEHNDGGAIYNEGKVGNISGDFVGNYGDSTLSNTKTGIISNITGDFINNNSGIDNAGTIGNIEGTFVNTADPEGSSPAIYNNGTIETINGKFIGNFNIDIGSAIRVYRTGKVGSISGYFSHNSSYQGGAVTNLGGEIGDISGDFVANEVRSGLGGGAAISNTGGYINNITGNFINNKATDRDGYYPQASGSAIMNSGYINNISANFIGNSAVNNQDGALTFGAIYGTPIGELDYNKNNVVRLNTGFALKNVETGEVLVMFTKKEELIDQVNSYVDLGYKVLPVLNATNLTNNMFEAYKEQYQNDDRYTTENEWTDLPEDWLAHFLEDSGIVNSTFINNYAEAKNGYAFGSAIYVTESQNLFAKDGYTSVISGNYVEDKNGKRPEAIYMASPLGVLGINANTEGKFLINDIINGVEGYSVKFSGDSSGYVQLNNNIEGGANIELNNLTLHLGVRDDVLNGNSFTANSGVLNMINGQVGTADFTNFTIGGNTDIYADVDLKNKAMDRITSDTYGTHLGNINIAGINLISDGDGALTEIQFADSGMKDRVTTGVTTTEGNPHQQLTAFTPLYKYNVSYDNRDDAGYMLFTRGGGGGNGSSGYNPAVLNAPVANLAAGQATINETFQYTFQHSDMFTRLPYNERLSKIKDSRFALSTEYNENLGGLAPEFSNKGSWVRPYVTFESMNLKNGPDVDAVTYGTLIGFDSEFEDLKNGWTGVTTGYVGYNGSQLNYSGNDTTMNGGLLGITQTFYKGNFWTAITASAGASVGETTNMYGKEDFTTLLAGIGSKTGYNFEFQEGKFILQPVMFMNYTFVNTFDYTNSAGVHIDSEPLHTIQLNPSIRLISNLKNGWQPYASVGMVWNLLNQTDTRANGVVLPEMHIKPYVEYGIGVQKRWSDKFTGFLQAMLRNGGRNGIAITGGFRWSLGKAPGKETVSGPKVKKVLKSRNSKLAGN